MGDMIARTSKKIKRPFDMAVFDYLKGNNRISKE